MKTSMQRLFNDQPIDHSAIDHLLSARSLGSGVLSVNELLYPLLFCYINKYGVQGGIKKIVGTPLF